MTDQITQQQINQTAWAACDTFRGAVDAGQYKDYILVMLFLKYISDLWNDHIETYRKQYGDDDARIRRRLERERFILPEGASFYDLYAQRNEPNIGELINIALEKIEDANRAKLEGVFRNIDFNSEANLGRPKDRNRRLKNMLEDFAKPALDLRPSRVTEDIIGECYIYLISRFASDAGKKAGEFFTPAPVSRLLAKLAAPQPGNTICDPACGSGSLLIQASQEVGSENFALYGQEVNGATWALARMNMFLHAKDAARIEWCDTLNSPTLVEGDHLMRFDVVLANPPFSLDKWGAEDADSDQYNRFWRGVPPKSKGDYAFITHMIEIAKRQSGRGGDRAAWRAVPGRRRGAHPPAADRGESARRCRRPAGQPVHHHGDPGRHPYLRPLPRGRRRERRPARRAVHRRQQGVHAGQDPERDGRGTRGQGAGDLRHPRRGRAVFASGQPRGDRRERLQPQHPPLRRHLRAGGRNRRRRRAEGHPADRGRTSGGACEDGRVSEGARR